MGLYGHSSEKLAQSYEMLRPGVEISEAQKAERAERLLVKETYGVAKDARRRRTSVGTITVTKLWPGHPDYEEG